VKPKVKKGCRRFKPETITPVVGALSGLGGVISGERVKPLITSPTSDLVFICGASGHPFTKESFGNAFREACSKAGVNKSAHEVRKISATRAANAGATVAQLKALFGWTDNDMPSLYTQTADRRKLARDAIEKLTINSEG